jgi:hypothetical protein
MKEEGPHERGPAWQADETRAAESVGEPERLGRILLPLALRFAQDAPDADTRHGWISIAQNTIDAIEGSA